MFFITLHGHIVKLVTASNFTRILTNENVSPDSMMSAAGELSSEIILDSGADTSALPLSYGDVGESCNDVGLQDYIDAQGGKLDIRDTRLATVDLGNGVILRERFIIANISSPLLAMGHIVRAGWELHHLSDGIYLGEGMTKASMSTFAETLCAFKVASEWFLRMIVSAPRHLTLLQVRSGQFTWNLCLGDFCQAGTGSIHSFLC